MINHQPKTTFEKHVMNIIYVVFVLHDYDTNQGELFRRLQGESSSHDTINCRRCVVLFFPSIKLLFLPKRFLFCLTRFLPRQRCVHHVTQACDTRGSVPGELLFYPCVCLSLIGFLLGDRLASPQQIRTPNPTGLWCCKCLYIGPHIIQ